MRATTATALAAAAATAVVLLGPSALGAPVLRGAPGDMPSSGRVLRSKGDGSGVLLGKDFACDGREGRVGFQPDPNKYYTIGNDFVSTRGRYWAQGSKKGTADNGNFGNELLEELLGAGKATKKVSAQNTLSAKVKLTADRAETGAHWRWVQVAEQGGGQRRFALRNRLTGQFMTALSSGAIATGQSGDRLLFTPWCLPQGKHGELTGGLRMTIATASGSEYQGLTELERQVRCEPSLNPTEDATCQNNLRSSQKDIRETYETNCATYFVSRPRCRSGWTSYKKPDYGVCRSRKCERYRTMESQTVTNYWEVTAVGSFTPRDQPGTPFPTRLGADDPLTTYSALIARVVGGVVGGLPGKLIGGAIGLAFQGASTSDQIESMADMLQDWVENHVAESIARNQIDNGNTVMATVRADFMVEEYAVAKSAVLASADYGTIGAATAISNAHLKSMLDGYIDDIENQALVFFHSNEWSATGAEINKQGWHLYKAAALDMLAIRRERVLLDAYDWCGAGVANTHADDWCSCSNLAGNLASVEGSVGDTAAGLAGAHAIVLDDHGAATASRHYESLSDVWAVDETRGGLTTRIYSDALAYGNGRTINVGEGVRIREDKMNEVRDLANAEADFDMNNWTYDWGNQDAPIHGFLDTFVADTVVMCERIRSEPAFRAEFEQSHSQ